MRFVQKLKQLLSTGASYEPLIKVTVSKSAILNNLKAIQSSTSLQIAPVLKSNAYGHGLLTVASILDSQKLPFFAVDSYFEAISLKKNGIRTPVLVIGYTPTETIARNTYGEITFTITSKDQAYEIATTLKQRVSLHIKIDTGMHRQGVRHDEIDEVLTDLAINKYLHIDGACSHFADADGGDREFTKLQIERWGVVSQKMKHRFPDARHFHVTNTAGATFADQVRTLAPLTNVGRLGIGLYGISPLPSEHGNLLPALTPALEMYTSISGTKILYPKEKVGYGRTFTADREMRIATVPVGYFEGVDRRLSNKGFVEVETSHGWTLCPIIARVSMNIITIDVTEASEAKLHSKVRVISSDSNRSNSFVGMAKLVDTIPYDLMVKIPQHIRREIVE